MKSPQKKPAPKPTRNLPATRDNTNVAMPAFMKSDVGRGTENMSAEDIEIPRLKLIQALSPELDQFNALRPGMFLHSAAEHIFDEPFRAVPVFYDRRFILWNPRESGGGILARADDGVHWQPANQVFTVKLDKKDGGGTVKWKVAKTVAQSGLADWGSMNPADPNSPPAATRMLNFLLVFPDYPELGPAVLTFQRSAVKSGRKLLAKIKTIHAPLFGMVFVFKAVEDSNRAGQSFWNIQATGDGLVHDEDQYRAYKGLHENFAQIGLNIRDVESMQDEVPSDEDGAENGSDEAPEVPPSRGGQRQATGARPRY